MLLHNQDDCFSTAGTHYLCAITDRGSSSTLDPMFSWTFAIRGWYVVGVGKYNTWPDAGGFGFDPAGSAVEAGERYKLNISRESGFFNPTEIPEPESLAIFALSLMGAGFVKRRRKSLQL